MNKIKNTLRKIGFKAVPNSKKTFPSKKQAIVLDDSISFHGALLKVEVNNQYKSKLFPKHEITIASDRIVTLKERNLICRIDDFQLSIKTTEKQKKGSKPYYGGFPCELSKKLLKNFPVIFYYDDKNQFHGLAILDIKDTKNSKGKGR